MHIAITGASAGIGAALVREYRRAGAKVTLVARRRELLDGIAAEPGGETFVQAADLADPERAADWIAPAERALGPIDVLVNNAGVQIVELAETVEPARGEALLRVDLHTPLRLIHALLPAMNARGSGAIVNVSSVAAFSWLPAMTHYNAAKAALAAFSESLRVELRRSGSKVDVITVYPGPVHTPMAEVAVAAYGSATATGLVPYGTPEVLARRVRRAVEGRRARVIYPRFYHLVRWFPGISRLVSDRVAPLPRRLAPPDERDRVGGGAG